MIAKNSIKRTRIRVDVLCFRTRCNMGIPPIPLFGLPSIQSPPGYQRRKPPPPNPPPPNRPPLNPLERILPQPRLLSALEDQPPESPNPPECPLMPLNAVDLPLSPLSCAQEFEAEERLASAPCVFTLTFLL